jgi:glycosyltransferase involved in cell wall biosynthesis
VTDLSGVGEPAPSRVSVVVVTAGRPDLLRQTLPALSTAVQGVPGAELVIVEQRGNTVEKLCAELDVAAAVVSDPGRGASRARNIGTARSGGDVVLYTDDDCIVPESWVEEHQRAHATLRVVASCGAVEGLTRAPTGDDLAALSRVHGRSAAPWTVGHGSNIAVRRSVLTAIGGWDERIGPGTRLPAGEDADLIFRLLRQGDVASGVGDPVVHVDWRTDTEDMRNLRSYELGAGTWIGKALRTEGITKAYPLVGGRFRLLAERWRMARTRRERAETAQGFVRFGAGLVRGYALQEQRPMADGRPREG